MPRMYLPYFLLMLGFFALLRGRSDRNYKNKQDSFWEKEQRANLTRKQDISGLDYICVPTDTFPTGQFEDDRLHSLETVLTDLGSKKILNLSGVSNTDLKMQYGAANLPLLSEYDANYTTLIRTIAAYGQRLAELGHSQEAIAVLEYGIQCKTDVSTNFTLLASLYCETGQPHKAEELTQTVRGMDDFLLKESTLKQLAQYTD